MAELSISAAVPAEFRMTDRGNALMMVAMHGADIRYCHQFGCWVVWNGLYWQKDQTGGALIYQKAGEVVDRLWRGDNDSQRWAAKCESKGKLSAMVELAAKDPRCAALASDFDADPMLLSTAGGVVDLETGEMLADPKPCLCTRMTPVAPATSAGLTPVWDKFLDQISCGRKDWQAALIRYLGYCLTGVTTHEKFVLAVGNGRNGKTTLSKLMSRLLGGYAGDFPSSMLLSSRMDKATHELESMKGVRFASCDEPDKRRELDREFLKKMVTGEPQKVRALYGHPYDMKPEFKLFLMSNHKPRVEFDKAFRRRVFVIPFDLRLDESDVNLNLVDDLMAEAPYILGDLISGCLAMQSEGLLETDAMREALESYEDDYDALGAFIEEECDTDSTNRIRTSELLQKYNEWAKLNNEKLFTAPALKDAMRLRGFAYKQTMHERVFLGIAMKKDEEQERRLARDRGLD